MSCIGSDSELFDTQTPCMENHLNSQEIIKPEIAWGKLFSTIIYLPSIDLVKSEFLLGRAKSCDLVLTNLNFSPNSLKTVSKQHFKINCVEENSVTITDLSKNGTYINKTLIGSGQKIILQHNDEISVGTEGLKIYIYKKIENELDSYLPPSLKSIYEISRLLGNGACGEVRLAIEKMTLKKYAIKKIVKQDFNQRNLNSTTRIQTEIDILQSLSHPCIISMKDIEETDNAVFIVLEYVDGGNLGTYISSSNVAVAEATVKLIFYQIALGLRYLHFRDISHRDLKPGNILLKLNKTGTVVKICDFGLSKILRSNGLMTTRCGTLAFAAPEVIVAHYESYTQQIDVWSLGVILYNMLSNELPFKSESEKELCRLIRSGKYHMKLKVWESVSNDAKDLIKKMLVVDSQERITIHEILNHPWIAQDLEMQHVVKELLSAEVKDNSDSAKRARYDFTV